MRTAVTFKGQLAMSDGVAASAAVADILRDNLPDVISVRRSELADDRSGTDYFVDREHNDSLRVDVKVRSTDWWADHGYNPLHDDVALEIWSVREKSIVGWTLDAKKSCDFILWWWAPTGRWCLVSFPMLCEVFREHFTDWIKKYRCEDQNTEGRYKSECVFVPRGVIAAAIKQRYGGERDSQRYPQIGTGL